MAAARFGLGRACAGFLAGWPDGSRESEEVLWCPCCEQGWDCGSLCALVAAVLYIVGAAEKGKSSASCWRRLGEVLVLWVSLSRWGDEWTRSWAVASASPLCWRFRSVDRVRVAFGSGHGGLGAGGPLRNGGSAVGPFAWHLAELRRDMGAGSGRRLVGTSLEVGPTFAAMEPPLVAFGCWVVWPWHRDGPATESGRQRSAALSRFFIRAI